MWRSSVFLVEEGVRRIPCRAEKGRHRPRAGSNVGREVVGRRPDRGGRGSPAPKSLRHQKGPGELRRRDALQLAPRRRRRCQRARRASAMTAAPGSASLGLRDHRGRAPVGERPGAAPGRTVSTGSPWPRCECRGRSRDPRRRRRRAPPPGRPPVSPRSRKSPTPASSSAVSQRARPPAAENQPTCTRAEAASSRRSGAFAAMRCLKVCIRGGAD